MAKLDTEKKDALAAAKKLWEENPDAKSKAETHEISNHKGGDVVLGAKDLPTENCVLHFKNNKNTNFVIEARSFVKLNVQSCRNCTITAKCTLITGHCEIWASKGVTLVASERISTLQIDMCEGLSICFPEPVHMGQIVQAAVKDMKVQFRRKPESNFTTTFDGLKELDSQLKDGDQTTQFISRFVDGQLLTEKLIRLVNDYPTTLRESNMFKDKGQATEEKLADFLQKTELTEEQRVELEEMKSKLSHKGDDLSSETRALAKKQKGNEEFKGGNIPQALVHYTESILICSTSATRANRAQCFLQLGKFQEALDDCDECIKADPTYVKAHFRRGLSLMRLERFRDAGAAFSKTLELEPKNKAAKSSLGLAEMKMMKQLRAGGK